MNEHPHQDDKEPTPDEAVSPSHTHPVRDDASPAVPTDPHHHRGQTSIRIYSHSSLLFWWPAWVVGYVMALLTYGRRPYRGRKT